jgi:hypothetical protein
MAWWLRWCEWSDPGVHLGSAGSIDEDGSRDVHAEQVDSSSVPDAPRPSCTLDMFGPSSSWRGPQTEKLIFQRFFRIDDDFSSLFGNLKRAEPRWKWGWKRWVLGSQTWDQRSRLSTLDGLIMTFMKDWIIFQELLQIECPLSFGFGDLNRDIYIVGCICAMIWIWSSQTYNQISKFDSWLCLAFHFSLDVFVWRSCAVETSVTRTFTPDHACRNRSCRWKKTSFGLFCWFLADFYIRCLKMGCTIYPPNHHVHGDHLNKSSSLHSHNPFWSIQLGVPDFLWRAGHDPMVCTRQEEVSSCKGQIGESARGICFFQIYISYSVICLEHIVDDISYV